MTERVRIELYSISGDTKDQRRSTLSQPDVEDSSQRDVGLGKSLFLAWGLII